MECQESARWLDDVICYSRTKEEHDEHVRAVLERCRSAGITLSQKKFAFAQEEVEFAGYIVSKAGVKADPKKLAAIKDFPQPTNLTELRSFLGLVEQLADFSKDIRTAEAPLRPLLQKKNAFVWEHEHTDAFEKMKEALTSTPVVANFDPALPISLLTDASRKNGLGYALLQTKAGAKQLIQCGSRFVSETESRYAMVELELLAIAWALKKCHLYLSGLQHFTVVMDHRPLVPILDQYTLNEVENPRIQRLKERMAGYNFTTTWIAGKDHHIADALSRALVTDPSPEDAVEQLELAYGDAMIRQINVVIGGDVDRPRKSTRRPGSGQNESHREEG